MQELPEPTPVGVDPDGREPLPVLDGADADGVGPAGPAGRDGAPRERADAARNRRRVLTAAAQLFAERGVGAVTMDDVAARAGVGKGTLYRRFGDRSGLATALLGERERELQARILGGPPPRGPGAPPAERLAAFARAYLEFLNTTLDLVLLSQTSTPGARHRTGAHAFWVTYCRIQLQAAAAPDAPCAPTSCSPRLPPIRSSTGATPPLHPDELAATLTRLAHTLST